MSNVIGIIVGVLITLFIALYAGVSSAEGFASPAMIVGGIIGVVTLLSMKDKVWILLPLLLSLKVPLPGFFAKAETFEYVLAGVLPFYLFNILFKKTSLTWNGNKYLDAATSLFALIIIGLLIRYPAGMMLFSDSGTEYVNSKEYAHLACFAVYYVVLSSVSTDSKLFRKILFYGVFVSLFSALLSIGISILTKGYASDTGEGITDSRFGMFLDLGVWICVFCISRYSLVQMVMRPWIAFLGLLGLVGLGLSGFRGGLVRIALLFMCVSFATRRYFTLVLTPLLGVFALFVMSVMIDTTTLPFGVQRTLSFLPFIEVDKDVKWDADASTEWRMQMWEWAMDKKQTYIVDRVWGDGFAMAKSEFNRLDVEAGYDMIDNKELFAARGVWHSGPISAIHRTGYVGLAVIVFMFCGIFYYSYLVCRIYYKQEYGWAVLFTVAPSMVAPIAWIVVFGDINSFHQQMLIIPIIKILLTCAKREGLYAAPSRRKEEYVPLMIQADQTRNAVSP